MSGSKHRVCHQVVSWGWGPLVQSLSAGSMCHTVTLTHITHKCVRDGYYRVRPHDVNAACSHSRSQEQVDHQAFHHDDACCWISNQAYSIFQQLVPLRRPTDCKMAYLGGAIKVAVKVVGSSSTNMLHSRPWPRRGK